jgi:hypothetical protein
MGNSDRKRAAKIREYNAARDTCTAARLAWNADPSDANRRAYERAADDYDDMPKPRGWMP